MERLNLIVMSFNVNFGLLYDTDRSEGGLSIVNAIRKNNPDVCLMQETNQNFESLLSIELGDIYPFYSFKHCNNWCAGGMGILSKFPFTEIAWLPSLSGWFHSWILHIETPLGDIQFLNLHLRPPLDPGTSLIPSPFAFYNSKNDRLQDLQNWWTSPEFKKNMTTIVCGDFNESHSGFHAGKAVYWLESEVGMTNSVNEFDPKTITWNWPLPMFSLSAFFDHIFYFKSQLRCISSGVIREGLSDHFPVYAVFESNTQ